MTTTVLITGANGFLGSHLVDALLAAGYRVRGMVRPESDLRWLQDKPVQQVVARLEDSAALRVAVAGVDAIIHNAGVTAGPPGRYQAVNAVGTMRLLEAVLAVAPRIRRFVYISSQAAGGPTTGPNPRREDDPPAPVSEYGRSKLAAERQLLAYRERLPITILRPPSIFGPRDRNFLPAFRLVARGWVIRVSGLEEFSLACVDDVVRQALIQLAHPAAVGEVFHIAVAEPVRTLEFADLLQAAVGRRCRALTIPAGVAQMGYGLVYALLKLVRRTPPFPPDKLLDLTLARWTISGAKARQLLPVPPPTPLAEALRRAVAWYRETGWL